MMQIVKKPPISGFPWYPKTLGQHMLKKRLELGLTQVQVAQQLGLGLQTISHWESADNIPSIYHYPSIISFLGYYPFRVDESEGGKIVKWRLENGLSLKRFARLLKIHVDRLKLVENNIGKPSTEILEYIKKR